MDIVCTVLKNIQGIVWLYFSQSNFFFNNKIKNNMQNLHALIEEQIAPIVNLNDIKEQGDKIKGQSITTFELSLIYASNVLKVRNLLKDSNFKQIAKESYNIQFNTIEEAMNLLLGIGKSWCYRLCKVSEKGTNETLSAYKKAQNDIASEKGNLPKFSIDGYHAFLNKKVKREEKEESDEIKVEKLKKLAVKLGINVTITLN